ncbi:MAG: GerAB/ArcD/ProY family transporter, partial [Clostridia bacterium]|nr:GerAB/ArcD/ProY family transporter [Clostridia bacterium]
MILFSYVIFFLFKSFIPIAEQKEYIELTLYINTPDVLNFMPFFIFAFYLCLKRLRVLGRISDILWAFTLASLIMLFALSISNINLEKMLPLGKVKLSDIIYGSFSTLNWYGDCVYFLFFIGEFNKTNNYKRSILLTFLLVFLIVIIFYIVFYST